MRTGGRVMPLELFFDLVFVLALTQCTALMAHEPTWEGLCKGLLALGILWWAWVGYAWLTSVVDPEEGGVRLALIAAMAAMLVLALAIPGAFEEYGLLFAGGLAVVRIAHIVLFVIASQGEPGLRKSVTGLAISTAIAVGIIAAASFTDGWVQGGLWLLALVLDMGGPALFGAEGWKLEPEHFAERHGLIIIIALGESIVAIGVGAEGGLTTGSVVAAVVGVFISAALWWLYFDVVALVAARRLEHAAPGRERNEIARDSFSFLHLPMIAGIVLLALGFKKTLEHVDDALTIEIAVAMLGGLVVVPAGTRRVPLAQRAPLLDPTGRRGRRARGAHAGRDRGPRPGDAGARAARPGGPHRLREPALRRAARSPSPPGGSAR